MTNKTKCEFFNQTPNIMAILGFLTGIIINQGRWNLVEENIFSKLVIEFCLAYVFRKCYFLWHEKTWKSIIIGTRSLIVFCIITLFNTFVVMYNKFIPQKMIYTDTVLSLFYGICFFVLIFMIEICFVSLVSEASLKIKNQNTLKRTSRENVIFCLTSFFIMCGIWGMYLYASFPGVMTVDSFSQWNQAGGQQELYDWFPVFHTLIIRICRHIWDNPASVIILQICFMAAVFSYGLLMFFKQGLPAKGLYLFTFVFAIFPSNGILMVNLQKDAPFMISFIWLTFLIINLIWNREEVYKNPLYLLGLFFALTLTALFRQNGRYITYSVIGVLLFLSVINKKYRLIIPSVLSLIAIFVFTGPIFRILNVPPSPKVFFNISPLQDIAGVYIRGGNLSQETLNMMEEIMPFDYWGKRYSKYTADTYLFPKDTDPLYRDYVRKIQNISTPYLLHLYIDTILRSPLEISGSRIAMTSLLWNLTRPDNDFNTPMIWDPEVMQKWESDFNISGIKWHTNTITNFVNSFAEFTSWKHPILYFFLWCAGIPNAVVLLISYYWFIYHKKDHFLILVPFISSLGVLVLSIPAQDYRYIWHHIVFSSILLLFALIDNDNMVQNHSISNKSLLCK